MDLFEILVTEMEEWSSCHLKVIVQRVQGNNESYTIPDCPLLCNCRLEALDKLFHLGKDGGGFLFVSKWFHNTRIVQDLLEYGVYDTLAFLRANSLKSLP